MDFVRERGRKVEDVMTENPITVDEETPLEDLVRLMEKKGIKRLPVSYAGSLPVSRPPGRGNIPAA